MKNLLLKSLFVVAALGCVGMSQKAWASEQESKLIQETKSTESIVAKEFCRFSAQTSLAIGKLFKTSADYIALHKDVAPSRGLITAGIGAGLLFLSGKLRFQFLGSILLGLGALVAWEGYAARKTTAKKIKNVAQESVAAIQSGAEAVLHGEKSLGQAIEAGAEKIDDSLQKAFAKTPFNRVAYFCFEGEKGLLAIAQQIEAGKSE